MKAAVLTEVGQKFQILDVEIADPIGHEVLVDVKASGLCHSDLHVADHGYGYSFPMVVGHEATGVVAAVGPDVEDFKVGDHVVGSLIAPCGNCRKCRAGQGYRCTRPTALLRGADEEPRLSIDGKPVNQMFGIGGFAEQVLAHENQLAKIPDAIPFPQAAVLGCGVLTGAGTVINTARVRPGETVAVVGLGGVGLNAINGARLAGASQIIGVDIQPAKEDVAKKFGATHFVNSGDADAVDQVKALTGGGADHVLEVVGAPVTQRLAVQLAGQGGGVYFIGMSSPDNELPVNTMAEFVLGQKSLVGVYMGSSEIKHDIPMYAQYYQDGRFNLDDLISQEVALSDINDVYEELKAGKLARSIITSF
ncbi:Zn-dependent alcohol dehydrogenase [Brevibacterium sp. 50QC2O2]|jgi:S-(hydroxymethyl)glutathione dehydrogenase/alcohol dehydrogenase|uniref:Zn-dependent alcohol dehydrogenase n=1 Tax=Brevibacterium sp. 50QC2O2 TaxID=2968459 RepID=UPI00211CF904|nr:Zn-dependent alcohol dehydrogenase [Brevibacterium sp. 50QC2O2]MCQ9388154.1 Zn-dependent alcohol dehydrogenase [Brevibacterium sp. 50QC2O2]